MNYFKNSIQNKSKSALVRRLFPMITLSILGLTSGSLGYYIAQNQSFITWKVFFQESKAVAQVPEPVTEPGLFQKSIQGAGSIDELAKEWNVQVPEAKNWGSKLNNVEPIAMQPLSNINTFQAMPLPYAKELKLYKTPYRNPSLADTTILPLSIAQSFLPLKVTRDPQTYWLQTSINGEVYYINPLEVLCNVPAVCLENTDTFANNPYTLDTLRTKQGQMLSFQQGKLW